MDKDFFKFKKILNNDNFKKWLIQDYKNNIFQHDGDIDTFLRDNLSINDNTYKRITTSRYLKMGMWIDSMDTIVSTFKLTDTTSDNNPIIYAFLYTTVTQKKINHGFYCFGASLMSMDGEYRKRICKYASLDILMHKYEILWDDLERYIDLKIKKLPWNFFSEYFYPTGKQKLYDEKLIVSINKNKLINKFLILSWFVEFYNIINNISNNHVNKLYYKMMKYDETFELDKKFYKKIKAKHGDKLNEFYFDINQVLPDNINIELGQKIIPLNIAEAQNPFSLSYKPWKEFLISEKAQDLMINGICNGFPYISDYFYSRDIRKTMFDNYVQYLKLEHSDQAMGIMRKLLEAQKSTYYTSKITKTQTIKQDEKLSSVSSIKKTQQSDNLFIRDMNMWLSDKFKKLYNEIDSAIEYSKTDIIMSEVAFGVVSEYVGETFYDYILNNSEKYDDDHWAKYIFEYIYNLAAINIHLGVIHGDLHLNNVTIYNSIGDDTKDNSVSCYVVKLDELEDNKVVYSFPSNGQFSCIIDFSRSLIKISNAHKFNDFNIENSSKLKNNEINILSEKDEKIMHNKQISRLMNFYCKYFNKFYNKNKSNLEILLYKYFDQLFPVLTAMDMFRFTFDLIKYISNNKNNFNSYKKSLIKKINNICHTALTVDIKKIMDDPNNLERPMFKQNSNIKIIKECFTEYIVMGDYENEWMFTDFKNNVDNGYKIIANVYFLNNEINNSLDYYNKFPSYIKNIRHIEKNKIINYDEEKKCHAIIKNIEKKKLGNLNIINIISKRHKEKYL